MGQPKPADATAAEAAHRDGAVVDRDTAQLVDEAVRAQYSGPAWEELRTRLWEVAFTDLTTSIVTGGIYRRCQARGYSIKRCSVLEQRDLAQEIAAKAVSETLFRLREEILEPGAWDPARGPLEAFFVSCCLSRVANAYRNARRVWNTGAIDVYLLERFIPSPCPSPDVAFVTEESIKHAIASIPKAKDRKVMVMYILGWSYSDIADVLSTSSGAVAVRMSRGRRFLRRTSEGAW